MPGSNSRKRTRSNLSITSPQLYISGTPKPKHLNLQPEETMAARRPPIIRATNEDLLEDVCALSQLLEHQCLDKTRDGQIYAPETKECHTYGLDAYNSDLGQWSMSYKELEIMLIKILM